MPLDGLVANRLFFVFQPSGKLILGLLLATHLLGFLFGIVALGERVESFEFFPLLLPLELAGGGVSGLLADCLGLCVYGLVKPAKKFLIIVPFARRQAVLGRFAETSCVFVAILLKHLQLVARIAFVGDQLC